MKKQIATVSLDELALALGAARTRPTKRGGGVNRPRNNQSNGPR